MLKSITITLFYKKHFMKYTAFRSILLLLFVVLLSACNKVPDHVKYIPKNAAFVVGIDTKELGKKMIWNALWGSDLLDDMKASMPDTGPIVKGLEDAGLDVMNTLYIYSNVDFSFSNIEPFTMLVPLADEKKWEQFFSENFAGNTLQKNGAIKTVAMPDQLTIAWSKDILILQKRFSVFDSAGAASAHTISKAFEVSKENIATDKRFKKLQTSGKDITLWVNYDSYLSQPGNPITNAATGFSSVQKLWKNSAFALGVDFNNGKINADALLYVSDMLKESFSTSKFNHPDNKMIQQLPFQHRAIAMAVALPMEGLKRTLEATGFLGLMNMVLMEGGISAEDIFQSFTGDMAVTINNVHTFPDTTTSLFTDTALSNYYKPSGTTTKSDYVYVMKIKDSKRFEKLFGYLQTVLELTPLEKDMYQIRSYDSTYLLIQNNFVVLSNRQELGKNFVSGANSKLSEATTSAAILSEKPYTFYLDVQQLLGGLMADTTAAKNAEMREIKKLLRDARINGGTLKNGAFEYHGELNFINQKEDALLQLLHLASKIESLKPQEKEAATSPNQVVPAIDSTHP